MANRIPLIVNASSTQIQELAAGDDLSLPSSNIVSVVNISGTGNISMTGNVTGGNLIGLVATAAQTSITSLGTLSSLSVTGNITGGNLTTAGIITVNSGAAATAIVNGASNAVGNIGSSSTYFNRLFAQATTALYADLAEFYSSDADYEPGTVLIVGGAKEVTISKESHDTRIIGVVSTNPAHVMNSGLTAEHTASVALTGRVPCRVIGPINKGDLVVASDIPGVAQALNDSQYRPGSVIGKALNDYASTEPGIVEVVVGRL
jgi:hypothetical protein